MVQRKICNSCGCEKDLYSFHKEKNGKLGRRATCKECVSERRKQHYGIHAERIKDKAKEYYRSKKSVIAQRQMKWREENREKWTQDQRKHRQRYRQSIRGTWRQFCEDRWGRLNRRTVNGNNPDWGSRSSRYYLERGVRLEMSYSEFRDWCESQASIIEHLYRESHDNNDLGIRPSIDRIVSARHYSLDNIQVVTWRENSRRASQT